MTGLIVDKEDDVIFTDLGQETIKRNKRLIVYREEEREVIPLCLDQGVGVIPWSPLARGFLTGSRSRESKGNTTRAQEDPFADELYFRDEDFDVLDALMEVSREKGKKSAQVALAWLLSVPGVVAPIVGTTGGDQLRELAEAVDTELRPDEIERLEAPYKPHPVLGHRQPTPRDHS